MVGGIPSSYLGSQAPCITYNTPGVYTVFLYEVNNVGDTMFLNYVSSTVNVLPNLSPNMTINPNPACADEIVTFSYTDSTATANYVFWDFGDGNFAGCTQFGCPFTTTNNYTAPGIYNVTLCVSNGYCDTVCISQLITINGASAAFTYVSNCRVHFFGDTICTNNIISETWDFGDGSPLAFTSNPIHTYAQNNQSFTVIHTIVTNYGTFVSSQSVIQIGGPSAAISGYQVNSCNNGFITYTAPCISGIVYTWTVAGGTPLTGTGCQINVSWNLAGGQIILTAWDSITDCSDKDTLRIPACCVGSTPSTDVYFNNISASTALVLYPAYVTGSTFTTNSEIIINGVFTIDVPFTFLNCPSVSYGVNALSYINPGKTLTYNSSNTLGKCDTMWDGNYISDATATLNIINGSVMTQAKNAVVSINGGKYFIENSTFSNDYKDIIVKAYASTHTGIVRNTTFNMPGNFLPAFPPLPFGHTKTVCGIEIEDNVNITIGDSTLSVYQNNFNNILVGVRTKNSVTKVHNCRFQNMVPTNQQQLTVPDAGTGVVSNGKKNMSYVPKLVVGGTPLYQRCVFNNVRIGIDASEIQNINIQNNNFNEISFNGIRVQHDIGRSISILDNHITNQSVTYGFNTAINILEVQNSSVNITNNVILQSNTLAAQNGTGIAVKLATPGDVILNITNNVSINRVRSGIWLMNLVGKNHVLVSGNTINFSKPNANYNPVHYGIRLEGCATVRCDTNTVEKSGLNPTLAMLKNLRGISIENSTGNLVSHNTLTKMGSGVFGYAVSSQSALVCNTLDRCYSGVYFTGPSGTCDIGDQVPDPIFTNTFDATGNIWFNNQGPNEIDGSVLPAINWYYAAPPPVNGALGVTLLPNSTNACALFFLAPPPVVKRDVEAGAVIRNINQNNMSADQLYRMKRHSFRKLTQHPTWLNLNTTDDTLYQNFYTANYPVNIGAFQQAELNADTGNVQNVVNICNAISCSNLIEHNMKTVYLIYAATWMSGQFSFTPADSATLLNIALQNPVDAGDGVYSARVMLDLPIDYYGASSQRMGNEENSINDSSATSAIRIYPNPASETINLEIEILDGQKIEALIFDLNGKLIMTNQLEPQQTVYVIDTHLLSGGVYLLQVTVNGEAVESKRLVIIK